MCASDVIVLSIKITVRTFLAKRKRNILKKLILLIPKKRTADRFPDTNRNLKTKLAERVSFFFNQIKICIVYPAEIVCIVDFGFQRFFVKQDMTKARKVDFKRGQLQVFDFLFFLVINRMSYKNFYDKLFPIARYKNIRNDGINGFSSTTPSILYFTDAPFFINVNSFISRNTSFAI